MIETKFTAFVSPIVSPAVDQGEGPTGPHSHMADLVPDASVTGEPCNKEALWVLEASAGLTLARQGEIGTHTKCVARAASLRAIATPCLPVLSTTQLW